MVWLQDSSSCKLYQVVKVSRWSKQKEHPNEGLGLDVRYLCLQFIQILHSDIFRFCSVCTAASFAAYICNYAWKASKWRLGFLQICDTFVKGLSWKRNSVNVDQEILLIVSGKLSEIS